MGKKNDRDQSIIEQLTHEIAWFNRNKFAKRSEQLSPAQGSLLVESVGCAGRTTQATKACSFACAVSAHRDLLRTRQHPMPLRLPAPADRRGRQREAGLHAGRVHSRAARAWEMGLPPVRNTDPGTGAGPSNRQGHPDRRSAGSRDGGQIRRPFAAVPARENLWPRLPGYCSLDTGNGSARRVCSSSPWLMRCAKRYLPKA